MYVYFDLPNPSSLFIVTDLVVLLARLHRIALTCMFIVTDLVILLARLY